MDREDATVGDVWDLDEVQPPSPAGKASRGFSQGARRGNERTKVESEKRFAIFE